MNRFLLLAAAVCACLAIQSCAQLPTLSATGVLTFEAPSPENVKISVVSAVNRDFVVAINGREVGSLGPVSPFSAILKPGTIDIVVSAPSFVAKARVVSVPNEEYVFEVSSEPTLTLKRRGNQFGQPRKMLAYATSR